MKSPTDEIRRINSMIEWMRAALNSEHYHEDEKADIARAIEVLEDRKREAERREDEVRV